MPSMSDWLLWMQACTAAPRLAIEMGLLLASGDCGGGGTSGGGGTGGTSGGTGGVVLGVCGGCVEGLWTTGVPKR